MPDSLDWKLFSIVIITIALSFILALLDKPFEYIMALVAIGSNIITAYVSYRFGSKPEKEVSAEPAYVRKRNRLLSTQVVVVFLTVLAAVVILSWKAGPGISRQVLPLMSILFLVFILYIFSLHCFRRRALLKEDVFKKERFYKTMKKDS